MSVGSVVLRWILVHHPEMLESLQQAEQAGASRSWVCSALGYRGCPRVGHGGSQRHEERQRSLPDRNQSLSMAPLPGSRWRSPRLANSHRDACPQRTVGNILICGIRRQGGKTDRVIRTKRGTTGIVGAASRSNAASCTAARARWCSIRDDRIRIYIARRTQMLKLRGTKELRRRATLRGSLRSRPAAVVSNSGGGALEGGGARSCPRGARKCA